MDTFARLGRDSRLGLFLEAAKQLDIPAAYIEKDFWVCWTLYRLFAIPELQGHLIFKGGTSLSKVYKVISRFSEDIDLTLGRELLGFAGDKNPDNAPSRKKRDALIAAMVETCAKFIQTDLLAMLRRSFAEVLPEKAAGGETWEVVADPKVADGQTLLFRYPLAGRIEGYVQPEVRLELGSRSDPWPTRAATVTPYAADAFPNLFRQAACPVVALTAERTFWEKVTILHPEAHRPAELALPPRYSRHYYDLAMLALSPIADSALADLKLLARVVEHKQQFFRCAWAHYETAVPGTIRLLPPAERFPELQRDYARMQPMIFEAAPEFDEMIETLRLLEKRSNK